MSSKSSYDSAFDKEIKLAYVANLIETNKMSINIKNTIHHWLSNKNYDNYPDKYPPHNNKATNNDAALSSLIKRCPANETQVSYYPTALLYEFYEHYGFQAIFTTLRSRPFSATCNSPSSSNSNVSSSSNQQLSPVYSILPVFKTVFVHLKLFSDLKSILPHLISRQVIWDAKE